MTQSTYAPTPTDPPPPPADTKKAVRGLLVVTALVMAALVYLLVSVIDAESALDDAEAAQAGAEADRDQAVAAVADAEASLEAALNEAEDANARADRVADNLDEQRAACADLGVALDDYTTWVHDHLDWSSRAFEWATGGAFASAYVGEGLVAEGDTLGERQDDVQAALVGASEACLGSGGGV